MKKRLIFGAARLSAAAGVILAGAGMAVAQPTAPLDVELVVTGTQTVGISTAGSGNIEYDGVATTADGSTQYIFDSESGFDAVIDWDGTTASVFVTENEASGGSGAASAGDMDVDTSGTLFLRTFGGANGTLLFNVPPAGGGSAVNMVASASSAQMAPIAADDKNDRVYIGYNDNFGAASEDIAWVAKTASAATPTILANEATLDTALSAAPGYVDATTNDMDLIALTVQSDGDVIASQGFGSGNPVNGSLLRITEAGTASLFASAEFIKTQAGADPNAVNIGQVRIEALSTDEILIHVVFSSADATLEPFIAVLSADGSTFTMLGSQSEFAGDSDVTATILGADNLFNMDGTGGDVDGNDDYFFHKQGSAVDDNAIFKVSGIRSFLDGTSVDNWTQY